MTRQTRWIGLVVLVTIGVGIAVHEMDKQEPTEVRVDTPHYQDLASTISTNGKVILLSDFQARAAFAGSVERIYVHVGDRVRPGQMLIKLKDPFAPSRYVSAEAFLKSARVSDENLRKGGSQEERINLTADLTHARLAQVEAFNRLATLKKLQSSEAASPAEVASAEQRVQDTNATVEMLMQRKTERFSAGDLDSSTARVEDARASLDTAKVVLANANITSSMSGTVYSIPVAAYDFVQMGAELLRVADMKQVEIRAYFDEPEIGRLADGQQVIVQWAAKPNQTWHGTVKRVPLNLIPMGTRTVGECVISVNNEAGDLLPNTDVTVTVTTGQEHNVLTIPRVAMHTDGAARYVYRVVDGKLRRTPILIGLINLTQVQVLSGLDSQDVVALNTMNNKDMVDSVSVHVVH